MTLTKNTFEKLAKIKKYSVEFSASNYTLDSVAVSVNKGVVYYFFIDLSKENSLAVFNQKYSYVSGSQDWNASTGENFASRIERDLKKANLI